MVGAAHLTWLTQQAVSRIESGEYEGMTLKTLEKIARAKGRCLRVDFIAGMIYCNTGGER